VPRKIVLFTEERIRAGETGEGRRHAWEGRQPPALQKAGRPSVRAAADRGTGGCRASDAGAAADRISARRASAGDAGCRPVAGASAGISVPSGRRCFCPLRRAGAPTQVLNRLGKLARQGAGWKPESTPAVIDGRSPRKATAWSAMTSTGRSAAAPSSPGRQRRTGRDCRGVGSGAGVRRQQPHPPEDAEVAAAGSPS